MYYDNSYPDIKNTKPVKKIINQFSHVNLILKVKIMYIFTHILFHGSHMTVITKVRNETF